MKPSLKLTKDLLISEGATRTCYRDPRDENKCLKVTKSDSSVNQQDLEAYHRVLPFLRRYIAAYEDALVETNLGQALACELIRDHTGELSRSYASFRTTGTPPDLLGQFRDFFSILELNNLFFYDFNPKNFIVQKTRDGLRLRYTDLKSLGRTRTMLALEHIPFFAKHKLKRRVERFMTRYVYPTIVETENANHPTI